MGVPHGVGGGIFQMKKSSCILRRGYYETHKGSILFKSLHKKEETIVI